MSTIRVYPDEIFQDLAMPSGLRFLEAPPRSWDGPDRRFFPYGGDAVVRRRADDGDVTVIAWSVLEFFQKLVGSERPRRLLDHADAVTEEVARSLLQRLDRRNPVLVYLETREDGLHFGRLVGERFAPGARYFLTLRSPHPEQQTAVAVPGLAKIAAWSDIADVVEGPIPGVSLFVNYGPTPAELSPRAGTVYFELVQVGPYWQKIQDERVIAIYLPPPYDPSTIALQLLAIRDRTA